MVSWLERYQFFVLALAGLAIMAGLAAVEILRDEQPDQLIFRDSRVELGEPIRVHVAGAVQAPGVYAMQGGDRVEDALASAGGAIADADLAAVNMARKLRDGEQILVPGPEPESVPVALAEGEMLDVNTATREQLIALPGIGEAYSRRIVDSRTLDGPFASIEDFVARGLVPASTFEKIRAMVTVSTP